MLDIMEVLAGFLIVLAFVASFLPIRPVPEGEMALYPDTPGVQHVLRNDVKPASAMQFENIVQQQFDYSCGSAALATLLNYYLGENFTEEQVIQGMMEYGDLRQIEQRRAFSLLDMKRFVTVLGYEGAGYVAKLGDLRALDKPCIVPIEFMGYNHFVVYRGMYGDHVFFADPFMGNLSFTVTEFEEMWHRNIVFIVSDRGVSMNALLLDEEDLRIVEIVRTSDVLTEHARSDILEEQQRLMETIGKLGEDEALRYQFKSMGSK
jgi:predicted double-glycine peptidase